MIQRISFESLPPLGEWEQPERHDRHSFFLLEKGSLSMEIDFQRQKISAPAIVFMHTDQVHKIISFTNLTVVAWAIDNASLNSEYIELLEEINPAQPVRLKKGDLIFETTSLALRFAATNTPLKNIINALIGLVIQLLQPDSPYRQSRFGVVTKAFKKTLGANYARVKNPSAYAQLLTISTSYLNECVSNATGLPVSWHIRQRVALEAKRLLYHTDHSVKEIASLLGYDDYPYFSRLFTKVVGMSPIAFRNKNRE